MQSELRVLGFLCVLCVSVVNFWLGLPLAAASRVKRVLIPAGRPHTVSTPAGEDQMCPKLRWVVPVPKPRSIDELGG